MQNEKKRVRVGATKRLVVATALLGVLSGGGNAYAQIDAGAAPATAVVDAGVPSAADSPEVGSNEDLVARLKEAKNAYDNLKAARADEESPTKYAWALMIAAMANLLLSGVKRTMKLTGKAKKILPWVAVALSGIMTAALHFAAEMPLSTALFYGGAIVGSVVLQELGLIPIKSTDREKSG